MKVGSTRKIGNVFAKGELAVEDNNVKVTDTGVEDERRESLSKKGGNQAKEAVGECQTK